MIQHRNSPVTFRRLVLGGVLTMCLLHCASAAGALSAAESYCGIPGNSSVDECGDGGLVCVPKTSGSAAVICVCRDLVNTSCDTDSCPPVWCDCDQLYVPQGECCPSCLPPRTHGCTVGNASYDEGDSWQLSACDTCTCQNGQPVCDSVECEAPECSNPVIYPDQCCPTCPVITFVVLQNPVKLTCEYGSEVYQDGERWNRNGDPCTTCFCESGETFCASQHCVVECENATYLPHICCPICPVKLTCEYDGEVYQDGERWNRNGDPCTTCFCESGETFCASQHCVVECENATYLPHICCPICPEDNVEITTVYSDAPVENTLSTTNQLPTTTTTITQSPSEQPTVTCTDESGVQQANGASWCPSPLLRATCLAGDISYTEHHCTVVTCQSPTWTPGSCECPVCPDHSDTVSVSAVLEVDYNQYLNEEDSVRAQLEAALRDVGVEVVDIKANKFGHQQTRFTITVSSSTFEEVELLMLLDQLKPTLVASLKAEDSEKLSSVTDSSNTDVQSSTHRKAQGLGSTALIITATASIVIAVVSAIIFAVIIVRAWRKRGFSKTVTV